jgi:hypothetical protein
MINPREATLRLEAAQAEVSKTDSVIRAAQSNVNQLKADLAQALYNYWVLGLDCYEDVTIIEQKLEQEKLITAHEVRLRQIAASRLSAAESVKGTAPTPPAIDNAEPWKQVVSEFLAEENPLSRGPMLKLRSMATELSKRVECEKLIDELRS